MTDPSKPEQAIWDAYLQDCKDKGKTPSAKDFALWAKTVMTAL